MTTPACPAPPSTLHTFSPSLSQEGGRESGCPLWVTRETGAWLWGGARNLGVLPPSLGLRLCLGAPGDGRQPAPKRRKWVSAGLARGVWEVDSWRPVSA